MKHILLSIYFLLVFYIVFVVGNDYRFSHLFNTFGSLNLFPFKDKIRFLQHPEEWGGNNMYFFIKEVVGNLLLLFPFPVILILLYHSTSKWKIIGYSFLLSCSIETVQLLSGMGNADIDDVLLNTLGAAGGTILAFWLIKQRIWPGIKTSLRIP